MSSEKTQLLAKSVSDLVANDIFFKPVSPMTPEEVVQTWSLLDTLEGMIEKRKAECREMLLREAQTKGEPNDTGNYEVYIDNSKVIRETRVENVPKLPQLTELMSLHGLPLEEVCDVVKTHVPSPSKIQRLVERGTLTQEEVDGLKKTTQYLRVNKSEGLKAVLTEMVERYESKKQALQAKR